MCRCGVSYGRTSCRGRRRDSATCTASHEHWTGDVAASPLGIEAGEFCKKLPSHASIVWIVVDRGRELLSSPRWHGD